MFKSYVAAQQTWRFKSIANIKILICYLCVFVISDTYYIKINKYLFRTHNHIFFYVRHHILMFIVTKLVTYIYPYTKIITRSLFANYSYFHFICFKNSLTFVRTRLCVSIWSVNISKFFTVNHR